MFFYMSSLDLVIPPLLLPWVIAGWLLTEWSVRKKQKLPHNLESCIMQLRCDSVLPLSVNSAAAATRTHVLYTHTFSDAKENLLRWRQPLWINSAAPYHPESFTISSGECAQQLWWHREQKVLKELFEEEERIITRLWGSYHLSHTIFLLSWRWTNLLLAYFSYI